MDYLLWLILLFVGMFVKCLGALLAFGVVYYLFTRYYYKNNGKKMQEYMDAAKEWHANKGDK